MSAKTNGKHETSPSVVRREKRDNLIAAAFAGVGTSDAKKAAPPFGSIRAAAIALYVPPFRFEHGYIFDAAHNMVADQDGFGEGSKVFDSVAARVRGWGRIGYKPDAEALQDEVGEVIAEALTKYWRAALASASPSDPLERANAVREGMR